MLLRLTEKLAASFSFSFYTQGRKAVN